METLLNTFVVNLTPKNNGGESLLIKARIFDNGDNTKDSTFNIYELTLCSYGASATITSDIDIDKLQEFIDKVKRSKEILLNHR